MLRKFGHNPLLATGEKLTRLVNTDFSKSFRLTPYPNTKNEIVWSFTREEADDAGALCGFEKFSPGTMLWGGICWRSVRQARSPVFVDEFLEENFQFQQGERRTVKSEQYCVLVRRIAAPSVLHLYPRQDDNATIHRTDAALCTVSDLFTERVCPHTQAAKFDDCWPIENV